MADSAAGAGAPTALTQEDLVALAEADAEAYRATRAAQIARVNSWLIGGGVLICIPLALFEPLAVVAAVLLVGFAWTEATGAKRVRKFDPEGLRLLATNQLLMLVVIVAYCVYRIHGVLHGPSPMAEVQQRFPELLDLIEQSPDPRGQQLVAEIEQTARNVAVLIYSVVAGVALLFQVGLALYYARSRTRLRKYLDTTPDWILRIQRQRP